MPCRWPRPDTRCSGSTTARRHASGIPRTSRTRSARCGSCVTTQMSSGSIRDRIGALGGSSGGHLVSLLGVLDGNGAAAGESPVNRESAKVQAVVARAAPTDLTLSSPRTVHPLFGFRLSARTDSIEHQRFVAASPVTHVTADDPPVLLIHGDADEVVPYQNAEVMKAALEKAGVPVELLRIPGAGHGPTFPGATNPPDYIGAMVEWFDRHLAAQQ